MQSASAEALATLLGRKIDYVGIDYSQELLTQARHRYPDVALVTGDAANVPIRDGAASVVISGCVLLHIPAYREAVRETARLTNDWAIFHRTPVRAEGPTLTLQKLSPSCESRPSAKASRRGPPDRIMTAGVSLWATTVRLVTAWAAAFICPSKEDQHRGAERVG